MITFWGTYSKEGYATTTQRPRLGGPSPTAEATSNHVFGAWLQEQALHLVGEGYCTAEDIDLIITDGLAPRWSSIGLFTVAQLNCSGGFVDRLGPMMKRIGQDARTDYPCDIDLAQTIHAALTERIPVGDVPEHKDRRDAQILAARKI